MDDLISCHVVSCNKSATNQFITKPYPIRNRFILKYVVRNQLASFIVHVYNTHHVLSNISRRTKFVYGQLTTTHYVTVYKTIHIYFSHMTYLMSHVTSLNNTYRWSYKLPHNGLQKTNYKLICSQTLSFVKLVSFILFFIKRKKEQI